MKAFPDMKSKEQNESWSDIRSIFISVNGMKMGKINNTKVVRKRIRETK